MSVREVLSLTEPVDELKRGTFSLQARVLEYRTVSAGVEVDLTLTASRHQQTIWTTRLTLLSPNNKFRPEAQPDFEITHGKGPNDTQQTHISGCEKRFTLHEGVPPNAGPFQLVIYLFFPRSCLREMYQPGCSLVQGCEMCLGVW